MPPHKQVTHCLHGGPVSKFCSCTHCTLCVCSVCSAYEGGLTTDCPGTKVSFDKQQEVCETNLDWTEARGWHLSEKSRSPHFEHTTVPVAPPRVDPRTLIAPSIDWARIDRFTSLQRELTAKACAWVLADRIAEDSSAVCTRLEDEIDDQQGRDPNAYTQDLRTKLKAATIDFQIASRRAEQCNDEFQQAARQLVAVLEETPPHP